jgi:protein ImuA
MSFSQVMRHDFPEEVPRPGPLVALRERIRHIEQPASHGVLPFGVAAIDRALPGGGLALGAVHEILGIDGDEEDGAAACGFIAGLLARLRMGPVLWCLKRPDLYGPGLLAHGLDPARLVIVTAPRDEDILWAIEEGLRAPGLVAVIGEIGRLPLVAGRRLQLGAERSGITAFLLRRWRNSEEAARERERPSAAVTRWRIAALPAREVDDLRLRQLIGQPRWRVELLRCRGGVPAQWVVESGDVEVADATGHVRLSPELADRPAAAVDRKEGRLAAEPLQRRTG